MRTFIVVLFVLGLSGFGLAAYVGCSTIVETGLSNLPLCFTNECVSYFLGEIESSITLANLTLTALVAIATIGGIITALLSYLNNSNTSALSNHIAHFSIFHSYINSEIGKLDMVSTDSVDILALYNFIFSNSKRGRTDVSKPYISFVKQLNREVDLSNNRSTNGKEGSFRYREHQGRVIKSLKDAGINMERLPRKDFFEAEGQVFSLLEKVNQSFCYLETVPSVKERSYI